MLAALFNQPQLFANRTVLWFVDNKATVGALLKGAARPGDVDDIVGAIHGWCARLTCRVWFEWGDSKSNSSDGLSRDGLMCQVCGRFGWKPVEAALPPPLPQGALTAWALGLGVDTVRESLSQKHSSVSDMG